MITGHFTVALGTLGLLALVSNPASWSAKLESKDGSGIGGTARVETSGPSMAMPKDTMAPPPRPDTAPPAPPAGVQPASSNSAKVTLTITGAKANSTLAWHLHQGKCGSNGSLIGDANAYTPLKVDATGSGNATTTVSAALTEKGEYYADVHASADQGSTVSACGNLEYQRTRADDL